MIDENNDDDNEEEKEEEEEEKEESQMANRNTQGRRRERFIVYCRAVPYPIRYCNPNAAAVTAPATLFMYNTD